MRSQQRISSFQKYIVRWWKTHRRDLPWRHTHDPYKICVSEVMLQQTQVSRVRSKYKEFLLHFPSVLALAHASSSDVLQVWKGMGYNRRALYLQRTARIIVKEYHNHFPISEHLLIKLPGVGIYTARAILVFAYKKDIAMVDTNIRRIITHFFFHDERQKESVIQEMADRLVPQGRSWEWHQALMDYGALAMPKTKIDKRRTNKPFRESNRFYRGRIVDRLREGEIQEDVLIIQFMNTYKKERDFIRNIITGLLRDGLVKRSGDIIHLPD